MSLHHYEKIKQTKTREGFRIRWQDYKRIVNWMYELIGNQNGQSTEECLEEIAKHVSKKEGEQYSVKDIQDIYRFVTSGLLESEVESAQEFSHERIEKEKQKIRANYPEGKGYHQGESKQSTKTEELLQYQRERIVRIAGELDRD